jgi:dimethylaniline monooxygenase (N-oxide forming)
MCHNDSSSERVAIIGGGVSGIAAAVVLQEQGFRTVIYEQAGRVGGIWRTAYPGAKLQNAHFQYKLKDFSWADAGIKPDWKPTAAHVQQYFEAAANHHQLNVRLHHTVRRTARNTTTGTWTVAGDSSTGPFEDTFSHLMVCTGLFDNLLPPSANAAAFKGLVLTRHQLTAEVLHELRSQGNTLAVVGNGKSGNDLATLAADAGILVKHVFRAPRWAVPDRLLGLCATWAFFTRVNTVMIPSWDYPSSGERSLHKYFGWAIRGFWSIISLVVWTQVKAEQSLQLCSLHGICFVNHVAALLRAHTLRQTNMAHFLNSLRTLAPIYASHHSSHALHGCEAVQPASAWRCSSRRTRSLSASGTLFTLRQ